MSWKIFDVWSWHGTIGRGRYLATGFVLLAVKYNIDRLVAGAFGYYWSAFDYFVVHVPEGVEHLPLYEVKTSVVIKSDPQTVWAHVVSFSQLPPPSERMFKTGIAYPIRADIRGQGVGAVRHCVFSTGDFVEPITVWDEPRLLRFDVTAQPGVMEEWSPYSELRPPHLQNYLISRQGQFELKSLPDGSTLLEGTTWYQNRFWPAPYWHLWSDYIIHGIHTRVLLHIKSLSEN